RTRGALGLVGLGLARGAGVATAAATPPWERKGLSPAARAEALVAALTLEQKFQQLVGSAPEIIPELPECLGGRHVRGIPALGLPTLRITNGPVGIGQNDCVDAGLLTPDMPRIVPYTHPSSAKATALPSAMAIAATFDPAAADRFGQVIAAEAKALALHVFEAPGVNLARIPVLGRNFEYFGEDPFLTGTQAVAQIRRIQGEGVIAMAKHFAANEQETNRFNLSQTVDEAVLRELYLLPFEMAVKDGGVASLMCSYNDLNGLQACENPWLLTEVLRDDWGFEGYVQSDFFAVKSTAASMKAGLDHLMPMPLQWAPDKLAASLEAGALEEADLDRALTRRYTQQFRLGVDQRPVVQQPLDVGNGGEAARALGAAGAVLLQNNGALPLPESVRSLVLIGKASQVYAQQAVAGGVVVGKPMGAGGGSSDVVPHYTVSPLGALEGFGRGGQVSLFLIDDANSNLGPALEAARAADAVIIMAGTIAEENADRATFETDQGVGVPVTLGEGLDWYAGKPNRISSVVHRDEAQLNPGQNSQTLAMIEAVMSVAPAMAEKTTLVLKDNAGVALPAAPWLLGAQGPAILEVWFPGQEDGNIVADLLFGKVNPSGKAPVTFPIAGRSFLDALAPEAYPGVLKDGKAAVSYLEGRYMGYRWYDGNRSGACALTPGGENPCVAFPFGHGMSYTTFSLAPFSQRWEGGVLKLETTVENRGDRAGAEVVQVYLGLSEPGQPPKRLVAFQRVALAPGEARSVTLSVDPRASHHPFDVFDGAAKAFRPAAGPITVYLGTSSSLKNLTAQPLVARRGL
ncbi:MAG: beta-glucosidase family protein, partial [Pseudomonadales bacterium]